jgi:hypothetical protein
MPTNDVLYRPWAPKSVQAIEAGPCSGGCDAANALDQVEGFSVWNCRHGSWIMPRERDTTSEEGHTADQCPGFCRVHPLLNAFTLSMRHMDDQGLSWGDQLEIELRAQRASETAAQTAARLAKEAEHDEQSHKGLIKYSVGRKESKWTSGGAMKFRVPRPCKYASLFLAHTCPSCNKVLPANEDTCSNGHLPEKLGGCWNHEEKGTCIYVHPDEPQWSAACSGELCYDRQRQVFHLKSETPAAQAVNRFQALGAPQPRHAAGGHSHNHAAGKRNR